MATYFHVTSASNRESITRHGLDWRRMGAARGIAGSHHAEQEGVFLAVNEFERDYFAHMNNTGGPVDVWQVTGIQFEQLVQPPNGYNYLPGVIAPTAVSLVARDIPPQR